MYIVQCVIVSFLS